jgi:PAS domain S-box-containing protein
MDEEKTREQLLNELAEMRQRVAELEGAEGEYRRAEEALRQSQTQFQDLYENAPNAYFSVGVDARIHRCNVRAGELLGCDAEELVGRPVFDLYASTPQGKDKALQVFRKFRAGETVCDEELQMQRADGTPVWISLTVNPVRDAQGQIVASRSMVVDITERKRVEEEFFRLAAVVEQAAEAVVITDLDGNIVYANPYFEASTGYTVAEALGQNPRILKSGHQDEAFYRGLWETITQGKTWRGVFINRRKDGALYHEAATIFPIKGAAHETMNYAAVKLDITERVRAEEALRRRNRELGLLNRVGRGLAATLDLQQVAERSLQAVTEIIGTEGASVWLWDPEQEGWLVSHAFFHHGRAHSLADLRLGPGQGIAGWVAQKGESAMVADVQGDARFFPGIDQRTGFRTLSLIAAPLRVRGTVIGVLEVVNKQRSDFDSHDQVLIETLAASAAIAIENARLVEALRQRTGELEAHNEELDAFAHTVAHDLKGPLSTLVGYAEVLALDHASAIDPDGQEYLHKVVQSGREMSSIIDELLLLAGARKMDVDVEPLDMATVVAEAQQRLAYMIEEYQAETALPETWPKALGYGPWIEEVWINYLSNGIKYGGRPPHVELGAMVQDDGMVRFWVRDDGPGLSSEEQARLFRPFTRLDQVRAKGHGLGLSIVRRIAERLGGQVGADSEVGRGSVFFFTLPGV